MQYYFNGGLQKTISKHHISKTVVPKIYINCLLQSILKCNTNYCSYSPCIAHH